MRTIGNIFWFILAGFESALVYFVFGLIWCITIIGIPFGKQLFKLGKLMIWPFGKTINYNFGKHPIANLIWLILGGFIEAVGFLVVGIVLCITIIGIPFGKQCFKLAGLSAIPFGASVN